MTEYFAMSAQAIKMQPANIMKKINVEQMYAKANQERVPFNNWHQWITDEMAKS